MTINFASAVIRLLLFSQEHFIYKMYIKSYLLVPTMLIFSNLIFGTWTKRLHNIRESENHRYPMIIGNIKDYVYEFEGNNVTFNCEVRDDRIFSRIWIKVRFNFCSSKNEISYLNISYISLQ